MVVGTVLPAMPRVPAESAAAWPGLYRFSIDQYHRLIEHGVLTPSDRAELLEGVIVAMSPIGNLHRTIVAVVDDALRAKLPANWHLLVQQPVTLGASEPQPDLAVVRGRIRDYQRRSVGPADIGLIVEVSDSSLLNDRSVKGPIYAAAGIACYWIVNLGENRVEVYSEPAPNAPTAFFGFRLQRTYEASDRVPLELDGATIGDIAAADLLP